LLGRLHGARQHRGIQGRGVTQFAALEQAVRQRIDLAPAEIGEPGAPLEPSDDPVQVALGLTMADQHDAGGTLLGGKDAEDTLVRAAAEVGVAFLHLFGGLAHARLPTNRSNLPSVPPSTTSSQWGPYSPTMEAPQPPLSPGSGFNQ